jgi:hypothetical protein
MFKVDIVTLEDDLMSTTDVHFFVTLEATHEFLERLTLNAHKNIMFVSVVKFVSEQMICYGTLSECLGETADIHVDQY